MWDFGCAEPTEMLCIKAFRWFSQIMKKLGISSLDAERHRRTPRLSAISGKAIRVWAAGFFGAVADSMRDAGRNLRRWY